MIFHLSKFWARHFVGVSKDGLGRIPPTISNSGVNVWVGIGDGRLVFCFPFLGRLLLALQPGTSVLFPTLNHITLEDPRLDEFKVDYAY